MEVSRLTFTKETKEKMEKPLSHFQKGKLRWDKLTELEKSGKLSVAKNRQEVMGMLGLGSEYGAGYSWVSNMISRGSIKEILTGFDKYNNPEYEYHVVDTNKPKPVVEKSPVQLNKPVQACQNTCEKVKATIKYGELTIEVESIDSSVIERIVETLANR